MIKMLYGWRDNPQRTAAECEQHYRDVHMGFARQAYDGVDGFIAIAYNRVVRHAVHDYNDPTAHAEKPPMDAFVEIWFEDRERLDRALAQPVLKQMFADHPNFMDVDSPATTLVYEVTEDVFLGRRPD